MDQISPKEHKALTSEVRSLSNKISHEDVKQKLQNAFDTNEDEIEFDIKNRWGNSTRETGQIIITVLLKCLTHNIDISVIKEDIRKGLPIIPRTLLKSYEKVHGPLNGNISSFLTGEGIKSGDP